MTFRRIKWFSIGTLIGSLLVLALSIPVLAQDNTNEEPLISPDTETVSTDATATTTDGSDAVEEVPEIVPISAELGNETVTDIDSDVEETEVLGTTTFKTGETVNVTGTYDNDVIVAGNNITIDAVVDGDVLAMGGTVTIRGRVEGNIRVMGGTVNIEGEVAKNATVSGGWINVANTAKIGKDAMFWGGTVNIDGEITGSLFGGAGTVTLDGIIGGNVDVEVGSLNVGSKANVTGDLKYNAGQDASISSSATINGETIKVDPATATDDADTVKKDDSNLSKQIGWKLVWWVSNLLLGLLLIYAFPKCVKGTGKAMFAKAGHSFLWGLLVLFVTPIVLLILMVTVIGIPISIIGFIAYGIGIYLASIVLGIALGNKILPKMENPILPMVIGVTIIYILGLIPFLGGLVGFVAALWVLGAWMVYIKQKKEAQKEMKMEEKEEKKPAKKISKKTDAKKKK
ncbi:hypothetical protein KKC88_04405 [Patescibacteria group bacterium]|nr:hypothetical protein [Patescibacteria group bacterium]MBU1673974.1 hypothetical protein [Patescibacteria group bacterium]MBU1962952.1 hypothetical protein [Patescibacteria group bacterium]